MTLRKIVQITALSALLAVAGVIDASAHSTGTSGSGMPGNMGGSAQMPEPGMMNQDNMPMSGQSGMPMMGQSGGMPTMRGMMMDGGYMHGRSMRRDRPFSSDEIKRIIDGKLALRGFTRLKVGGVEENDENTFVVDILTLDDSLAAKLTINRQSGHISGVE